MGGGTFFRTWGYCSQSNFYDSSISTRNLSWIHTWSNVWHNAATPCFIKHDPLSGSGRENPLSVFSFRFRSCVRKNPLTVRLREHSTNPHKRTCNFLRRLKRFQYVYIMNFIYKMLNWRNISPEALQFLLAWSICSLCWFLLYRKIEI